MKKINSIVKYVNWIVANYQLISKINANTPGLRIISCKKYNKIQEFYITVQVSGKNIFPVLSSNDFYKDKSLIDYFNLSDQIIIRNILRNHDDQFTNRILSRTYNRDTKRFIFSIEFFDTVSNKRKTMNIDNAQTLYRQIKYFNEEDAFLIKLEAAEHSR